METQLVIPSSQDPSTIAELLQALRKAHFMPMRTCDVETIGTTITRSTTQPTSYTSPRYDAAAG